MRFSLRTRIVALAVLTIVATAAVASAQAPIRVEAFAGQPFGVGRLEVQLPKALEPPLLGASGLGLADKNGRVLYPAVEQRGLEAVTNLLNKSRRPVVNLVGKILEQPQKPGVVYFLFTGQEPLVLTLQTRQEHRLGVTPLANPQGHAALLAAWWRAYTVRPTILEAKPDYPPLVQTYLQSMLARRLGLPLPADRRGEAPWLAQFDGELGLLREPESAELDLVRDRFLQPVPPQAADQPLPQAAAAGPVEVPEPAGGKVESIALRVPAECLYVRFGSFANFLWFQDTLARWRGDLRNLIALRGMDCGTRERFEDELGVESSALARLFGDALVSDVAIVGCDTFFRDGGAYGLLFEAKNSALLGADLVRQRSDRAKKSGAKEQSVKIGKQKVSYFATPDGAMRSYYAVAGDYHFVTTSRALVARFLECCEGKGALGASVEFRYARSVMPLDRKDAVFVYLSREFFGNLAGPHYRIEIQRRLAAAADIAVVELAQLASAAEGKPGGTIEELKAGALLPPEFGQRDDGSHTVLESGRARDSLRGVRGHFTPIPDVPVAAVSPRELAAYRQFTALLADKWQPFDPVMVGIRREKAGEKREKVSLDVRMSPLDKANYQKFSQWFGPPDTRQFGPAEGDAIWAQMRSPRDTVFGALQSVGPAVEVFDGRLLPLGRLRNALVGYLGTTGEGGLLSHIGIRHGPPDPAGYSRGELGLWRRQLDGMILYSFQPEVLQAVAPQVAPKETPRPAQLRLHVADLSQARMAPFVNNLAYARTRQTALGNLRLMHQMTQQLHVPAEKAEEAADAVLDARLVCPFGGKYVYRRTAEGVGYWTSTVLEKNEQSGADGSQAPPGFVAPPLNWFRGLDLDALLLPEGLSAHAEVVMQK